MINYDRVFIQNITEILKPLYELLKVDQKFEWGEKKEKSFIAIKERIKNKLEVYIPDTKNPFVLETDSSDVGIGGALRQEGKPIAFISRSLSKAEKSYGITEKEVLACLWCMEKLKYFLSATRLSC